MAVMFTNPNVQYFDANGEPLAAGELYFYEAGTSTPLDTYSDDDLLVANANPVVLNSAGRAGSIRLDNADYKVVLKDADGNTIWTIDDVHGGAANPLFSDIDTHSSNHSITSADNGKLLVATATMTFTLDEAADVGASFRVGIMNGGAGVVTIQRDGADTIDSGMTAVRQAPGQGYFFQSDGVDKYYTVGRDGRGKGADIASAATLNLGEDGHMFHVTGTTGVTAIEARPQGWEIVLVFDGILTITHNASTLILPGAADFTTAAGDTLTFTAEDNSGAWKCTAVALAGSIGFDVSGLTLVDNPPASATIAGSIGSGSANNRKFRVGEVGGWAALETQTASTSASLDFDLTQYIADGFDSFELEIDVLLPATDAVNLLMRFSTDGGSTFDAGASDYDYAGIGANGAGSTINVGSNGATSMILNDTAAGVGFTAVSEGISGKVRIINSPAAAQTRAIWNTYYKIAAGTMATIHGAGSRLATQDTDAIQLLFSSGNIVSGSVTLLGRREVT